MAVQNNKKRILCLMEILLHQTDEEHILNAIDLAEILKNQYGIVADRRTIYAEVAALQDFGLDVVQLKGKTPGYYIGSRDFEFAEVKLLVDAVQSSKFITEKKSKELIRKLEQLCSDGQAKQLNPQVVVTNRPKTENETIYYNVDRIHTAISRNRQISFQYTEWITPKKQRLKKSGALYVISPLWMLPDDDCYYMIGYDEDAEKIKHYRVDKMRHIEITGKLRKGEEYLKTFQLAEFAKKTFNMYAGKDEEITFCCRNEAAGIMIDRFGNDIWTVPDKEGFFRAKVTVTVSDQFFGWLAGLGKLIRIAAPVAVRNQYQEYLRGILETYEDTDFPFPVL